MLFHKVALSLALFLVWASAETGPTGDGKEEEPEEYKGHNTAEESEEHELRTHDDKSPPEGWKDNSPPEALIEEKESQSTGHAEETPEAPESLIEESESESTGAAHEEAAADVESEETEEDGFLLCNWCCRLAT